MAFFHVYDDEPSRSSGNFDPSRYDATKQWLKHHENALLLTFLARAETDGASRRRAREELDIAERKKTYWSRQANFDTKAAERGAERLQRMWK